MNYNDVIEKAIHKFTNELQCTDNFESKLKRCYKELTYTVIFWCHMEYISFTKYANLRFRILDWYNTMTEDNEGEKV